MFGYEPGDIFSCVADIGWITGHSYVVYGPLSNGATSVIFESVPTYPDPGRYWETVERLKINQFYGAPTAIRLLLKYEEDWVKKYDRSSLRVLGTGTHKKFADLHGGLMALSNMKFDAQSWPKRKFKALY